MSWFENIPSVFESSGGATNTGPAASPFPGGEAPGLPSSSPGGGGFGSIMSSFTGQNAAGGSSTSSSSGKGFDPTSLFGAAAAGGIFAYNMSKGDKPPEGVSNLGVLAKQFAGQAGALSTEGMKYMSYLEQGTLPPGMEEQVNQMSQAAKASYLQSAAKSGMNADPTQNSALAQDLNTVGERAAMMRAQMAQGLLQAGNNMITQGIQYSQMQERLFEQVAKYSSEQSKETGSAITNFASAMGSFAAKALPALITASDRRVKTDVERVGTLDNGLPVYRFRYLSGGPMQIGLMAQDVELVNPEAVVEFGGTKYVNYEVATQTRAGRSVGNG